MSVIVCEKELIAGINWGAIREKGWFGATEYCSADLDLICYEVNDRNEEVLTINFERKETVWGKLGPDDMSGDIGENDKEDNEWIHFDLEDLACGHTLYLAVINYTEQPLNRLTHFDYRIYSGKANKVDHLFYFKDIRKLKIKSETQGIFLGMIRREGRNFVFHNRETPLYAKDTETQLKEILAETAQDNLVSSQY